MLRILRLIAPVQIADCRALLCIYLSRPPPLSGRRFSSLLIALFCTLSHLVADDFASFRDSAPRPPGRGDNRLRRRGGPGRPLSTGSFRRPAAACRCFKSGPLKLRSQPYPSHFHCCRRPSRRLPVRLGCDALRYFPSRTRKSSRYPTHRFSESSVVSSPLSESPPGPASPPGPLIHPTPGGNPSLGPGSGPARSGPAARTLDGPSMDSDARTRTRARARATHASHARTRTRAHAARPPPRHLPPRFATAALVQSLVFTSLSHHSSRWLLPVLVTIRVAGFYQS